jgi:hypothetical protein
MIHQIISLSHARKSAERTPLSVFRELPERRLEVRFGKLGLADFFDFNTYGTDSNFQFMNWTVDNAGSFDYAADTRGYTFAAMFEYHDRWGIVRFAEGLMPKVANGIHLDADIARARSENLEFEFHRKTILHQQGILRLLTFVNHANMGDYQKAIDNFLAGVTPKPEITFHPLQTTIKYGFGANFEQPLNEWLGVFGRWDGTKASTSRTLTQKWIRRPRLVLGSVETRGIANGTARALPMFPTGSRGFIRNIWPSVAMAFFWETGA